MRFVKSHASQISFYILLVVAIYILAVRFSEFEQIVALLKKANPLWVLAAAVIQVFTYLAAGRAIQQILATLGYRFRLVFMAKLDLAILFFSHTIPSGAFTGMVYMIRTLKRRGVPQGQGTATSLILLITGYIGFFLLLLVGFLALPETVQSSSIPLRQLILALVVAFLILVLIDRAIAQKDILGKCLQWLLARTRLHQRLHQHFESLREFISELAEGREFFMRSKRKFISPIISQFAVLFFDCLTLLVVFHAFGTSAPLTVIIIAYAVGRLVGALSLLPGGLGSFDAAQIVMLKALGVPLATATLVTLFFRLFSYWIPTPIGLYYYKRLAKDHSKKETDVVY